MRRSFTIVMPLRGTPRAQLAAALTSVARQTAEPHTDFDITIVEDGHYGDLHTTLSRFSHLPINVITLDEPSGISRARNAAVEQTDRSHVLLLDSDDLLAPECVAVFAAYAAEHPNTGVCFSNALKLDEDLATVLRIIDSHQYMRYHEAFQGTLYDPIYHAIFVGHALAFQRSELLHSGGFDPDKRCGEITDVVLRLWTRGVSLAHINSALYGYRQNATGLSKHPGLHKARIDSLVNAIHALSGETATGLPLGRVTPYGHMHYQLTVSNQATVLPYIDYSALTLCNPRRLEEAG